MSLHNIPEYKAAISWDAVLNGTLGLTSVNLVAPAIARGDSDGVIICGIQFEIDPLVGGDPWAATVTLPVPIQVLDRYDIMGSGAEQQTGFGGSATGQVGTNLALLQGASGLVPHLWSFVFAYRVLR